MIVITITLFTWLPLLTATAQQQQTPTTTTGGTVASAPTTVQPLTPTPPLTLQEQQQQIRLQNVIASTTLNLQEAQKQIGGVVFTPRWSQPIWINANSVAVLVAYCLPGEFADSGQEILGGFGLEVLESYGVALPQGGFMAWMAVVGNEDIQNRRLPAALGVMCASDLNKPETRVLSPQKQQEINNINEQFVNIQNTQINDIDNLINVINTVTTTTTTTPPATPPTPPGQNRTGGGAAGTTLAAAPIQQQDTTPPTIIVPQDIAVQATNEQGAQVFYTVTVQDNVDGTITLEEDGGITRDNVTVYANMDGGTPMAGGAILPGGDIEQGIDNNILPGAGGDGGTMGESQTPTGNIAGQVLSDFDPDQIECSPNSGSLFPIGETTVECTAKDSAGNEATQSFPVTVEDATDTDTFGGTILPGGDIEQGIDNNILPGGDSFIPADPSTTEDSPTGSSTIDDSFNTPVPPTTTEDSFNTDPSIDNDADQVNDSTIGIEDSFNPDPPNGDTSDSTNTPSEDEDEEEGETSGD
jgi:hypothetical protein